MYIFGTLDVTLFYTIIEIAKGIEVAVFFLQQGVHIPDDQSDFIVKRIQFILKHNFFVHNNSFYLLTWGTVMGTRFVPSYANLYMG